MIKKRHSYKLKTQTKKIDLTLLATIGILLITGVVMVYEASVVEAFQLFSDKAYFAKLQLRWALVGLVTMLAGIFVPIKLLKKLALPFFAFSLLLLIAVLIPGFGINAQGASRWINIGNFTLQPSELAKLSLIIYLAALFDKQTKLGTFFLTLGATAGLVMLQPDLGTAVVIAAVAITVYYLSQAPLIHFFGITLTAVLSALGLIASSVYRRQRLLTFLDPSRDPLGASYHIRQVLIALGSGGVFGTGIGRSLQKFQYLPEATTDSIFAVIAEETGFVGTVFVVGLFTFFAYKGLNLALRLPTRFMSLLAAGITVLISFQAFLNLGAMSALVPLTGITLPFISYGGSSLVVTLAASGLLLNLSRYKTN